MSEKNNLENEYHLGNNQKYGGFWIRIWAGHIDLIVILLIWTFFLFMSPATFKGPIFIDGLILFYFLIFLSIFSTTPGKALLGLKVIDAKKMDKLKIGKAIGRTLLYSISFLIFGLGFLFIALDKKKQGFHDKLMGTIVVRDTSKKLSTRILMSVVIAIAIFILAIFFYRYSFNSYLVKPY